MWSDKFIGITNTISCCVSSIIIRDGVAPAKPQRGMWFSFFLSFCYNERLVRKGRYCSTELFRRRRKDAVNGNEEEQQFLLRYVLSRLIVFRDSDSSSRLFSYATDAIKSRNDAVGWKVRSAQCGVRSAECGVRSAENEECGK